MVAFPFKSILRGWRVEVEDLPDDTGEVFTPVEILWPPKPHPVTQQPMPHISDTWKRVDSSYTHNTHTANIQGTSQVASLPNSVKTNSIDEKGFIFENASYFIVVKTAGGANRSDEAYTFNYIVKIIDAIGKAIQPRSK